jgi:hypothetical protein
MPTNHERRQSTPALRNFSAGMIVLSEVAPRHLTMAQASFFLTAALADRAGRAATYTDLKETLGPLVSRSLNTTYKIFLKEGRMRDGERIEGVGWLTAEVDPLDNRRKFLRLTRTGQRVIDEVAAAITMET